MTKRQPPEQKAYCAAKQQARAAFRIGLRVLEARKTGHAASYLELAVAKVAEMMALEAKHPELNPPPDPPPVDESKRERTRAQLLAALIETFPRRFGLADHCGIYEIDASRSYFPSLSVSPRLWLSKVGEREIASGALLCCPGGSECYYAGGSTWDAEVLRPVIVTGVE